MPLLRKEITLPSKPYSIRNTTMLQKNLAILLVSSLMALASPSSSIFTNITSPGPQRPFYIIGHMVNSVDLIEPFLESGSNVLESDVHFSPDGSVKELHHGFPCDLGRECEDKEEVADYLKMVRRLTDPLAKNGYHGQLAMLFFDLKLESSGDKRKSGVDMARHLVEHLWMRDGSREQEMRVLLYIENELNSDFILGFVDGLKQLGLEHHLKDIGFDGGLGNLNKTRQMFENLNVTTNVWQGDGITNLVRSFRGDRQLRRLLSERDSNSGFIRKVYDWTVDRKSLMRRSLRLGVDGMITNNPGTLMEVLGEKEFEQGFRLAGIGDDPFAHFNEGFDKFFM